MTINELKGIVRQRFETGAYARTHFEMSRATFEQMRDADRAAPGSQLWAPGGDSMMSLLTGIPIRVNNDMGPGAWKLVDDRTGDMLRFGCVAPSDAIG